MTVQTRTGVGLWLYDIGRGLRPLTLDGEIWWPLWSPTEPVIFFSWLKDGLTVQTPTPPPAPVVTHINLIQNWTEELKRLVPAR